MIIKEFIAVEDILAIIPTTDTVGPKPSWIREQIEKMDKMKVEIREEIYDPHDCKYLTIEDISPYGSGILESGGAEYKYTCNRECAHEISPWKCGRCKLFEKKGD